jgi:hypothetical protein
MRHILFASAAKRGLRLMLTGLLGSLLWLAGAGTVAAQSADKILNQGVKALGGDKALKRVGAWQAQGRIARRSDGAMGRYQSAGMQPDFYFWEVEIRGFEASEGFNGKSAWQRDSREGLRTLTGAESVQFRAEANYRNYRWLNYKKEKSKLAYAGVATVRGKPAHTLVLTTTRNVKIKLYFDTASGLPVKEEWPAGEGMKVLEYDGYRAVNGVMEPFKIMLQDGEEQFEITLEQVVHNPAQDRARFDFPKFSNDPLPDIPTLLKKVSENQDALDELLEKYTYTQTVTKREFDKSGVMKEKETSTYEITFYRGRRVRRLAEKNGKPLSEEEREKQTRQLEKVIKDIDKQEAEKERKEREAAEKGKPVNDDDRRVTIADVLRSSRLVNPRREQFRRREVIVFDFEPHPGYKPKKDVEKLMQKLSGVVWVDASDRQVVRVEARLIDSYKVGGGVLASIKPGAAFVIEQDRINDEIWLPSYAEFNLSARIFLFAGFSLNQTVKYGDYQRFNVEAEKEKLKPPSEENPKQP